MAGARPRLSARPRRPDWRQPGPAHRGRHPQAYRAVGQPRRRPAAGEHAAGELHRHLVGAIEPTGIHGRRLSLLHSRLHGLVRLGLCLDRLAADLARGRAVDRPQRRALCARSGASLRPGAGERKRRKHRPLPRRAGRAPPARGQPQPRHRHHGRSLRRIVAADLDHLRLRLGRHRGADHRGLARLFQRQPQHGRADDGGRRLQPGARLAALVRRTVPLDRRLARDFAPRQRLQGRRRRSRPH